MLKKVLDRNEHHSIKVVNTEVGCESITGFLESNNIPLRGKQFEMIKQI
jgi:hypothetical protein